MTRITVEKPKPTFGNKVLKLQLQHPHIAQLLNEREKRRPDNK